MKFVLYLKRPYHFLPFVYFLIPFLVFSSALQFSGFLFGYSDYINHSYDFADEAHQIIIHNFNYFCCSSDYMNTPIYLILSLIMILLTAFFINYCYRLFWRDLTIYTIREEDGFRGNKSLTLFTCLYFAFIWILGLLISTIVAQSLSGVSFSRAFALSFCLPLNFNFYYLILVIVLSWFYFIRPFDSKHLLSLIKKIDS